MRKIKQADIEFHGSGVRVIQGMNKSGKTTVAQSIALTLNGAKSGVPGMITSGEEKAEIIAYTDDGLKIRTVVTDTVKQDVSRIGTSGRYAKVSGGTRAFLESLCSGLEMPFAIKDWTDEAIIDLLKNRVGITQKIADIDAAVKALAEERTQVVRERKKFGTPIAVEPCEHGKPIDELQAEKQKALAFLTVVKTAFEKTEKEIHTMPFKTEADIDAMISRLTEAKEKLNNWLLTQPVQYSEDDIASLDAAIIEWNKNEAKAAAYDAYLAQVQELETLDAEYKTLTEKIEAKRQERKAVLCNMNLGVDGLQINEANQLVHNGAIRGITKSNLAGNWSNAETLEVFLQLGARFSGDIKTIVIDNAESLDVESIAVISKWAAQSHFLVILLKVREVPEEKEAGVIYLKNGEVVA
ncbi:MAG: AAA family ATPase [Treponema sp.]